MLLILGGRIMKKILFFTIIGILIISASVGFSNDYYTFDILNEMSLKNDLQIEINELKISEKELILEDVLWDAKYFGVYTNEPSRTYSNMKIREVNPVNAEIDLLNAENDYDSYIENNEFELHKLMMDWELLDMELANLQNELDHQELVYANVIKKKELGLISEYDLNASQMAYDNLKLDYENLVLAKESLFKDIEMFVGEEFDIEKEIEYTIKTESIESLLDYESALELDMVIFEKLKNMETSEIMFNYAVKLFKEDSNEFVKSKYDFEISKLDYQNTINNFNIQYHNDYDNLNFAEKSYELSISAYNLATQSYNVIADKYEKGLISYEDLLAEEIRLNNSEYAMMNKLVQFNKEVLNFKSNY